MNTVPKHPRPAHRRAFTLLELVLVVAILVMIAGFAFFRAGAVLDGDESTIGALERSTRVSMGHLRETLDGPPERPGFRQDLGELPLMLADLLRVPASLPSGRAVQGTALAQYDAVSRRGWNGQYLALATGSYHLDPARGFVALYGVEGDPALLDAWNHPIVLQLPPAATLAQRFAYARLVSAGPDGTLNTDPNLLAPDVHDAAIVGDDVIEYLSRSNGP